jgi:superfamily II DNA or RNA helicase
MYQIIKQYYRRYLKTDNILSNHDIYHDANSKLTMLRGEYKSFNNSNTNLLKSNPKKINGFICDKFNINPLEKFNKLSNLQKYISTNSDEILYQGSLCFTASCGDGKTMAAIYLMHLLNLKTLIISTRNAVNDQWYNELKLLYPDLIVESRIDISNEVINTPDVLICTPQYIVPKLQENPINKTFFKSFQFDLIIYDEVHSILSEQFSLSLALPFILKLKGYIKHLPYMIGLTASLPNIITSDYKIIKTIFGEPIIFESEITKIPVYFTDYRDTIQNRGFCDVNYIPMNDEQSFDFYSNLMIERNIIPSIDYKLIIITSSIDSSIYCGINACLKYNLPVLIIRSNNESSFYITPEIIPDYYRDIEEQIEKPVYNIDEIKRIKTIKKIKHYQTSLDKTAIIVGTYHRLKEGFNCMNIVYGICTKFIWSDTARIQILGRIRRNSTNKLLNEHKRLFFVNSGRIPSNLGHRKPYEKIQITYNEKYESEQFNKQNYIRLQLNQI